MSSYPIFHYAELAPIPYTGRKLPNRGSNQRRIMHHEFKAVRLESRGYRPRMVTILIQGICTYMELLHMYLRHE